MDAFAWKIARSVYPVLASVAVVGLCLNSLLLLATICSKNLRSATNILIGFCAFFDIMHETGYLIQFPILFSDYYIDSYYCSIMQASHLHLASAIQSTLALRLQLRKQCFLPAMGRAAGAVCVLCTGIDRTLCLLVSIAYKKMNKSYLLMCHLLSIGLFCGWTVYLMVAYWASKQQICSMPAPFHGDSLGLWSNSITVVNIFSALLYFVTWQVVKSRGVSLYQKKIFKSIAVVMTVEVTGWFISSMLINLSKIYVVPERRPPFHYVACLFVNSGIAVKTLVYYWISSEYRRAIRNLLGLPVSNSVSDSAIDESTNVSDM